MNKKFFPKEAIKFGWEVSKKNWKFFLGVFVIQIVLNSFPEIAGKENMLRSFLDLVSTIVVFFIDMRFVRTTLEFGRAKDVQFSSLFVVESWRVALNYLLSKILSAIIIVLGLVLLIVPGVIFAYRLSFTQFFVLDKNMGAIEAMKESWKITKGSVLNLMSLSLLSLLVVVAGALVLIVGLLWAIPTIMVAQAYVYRKLSN